MAHDDILLEQAYERVLSDNRFNKSLDYLKNKNKVLLLTTSNRWSGSNDVPKSTRLAQLYQQNLPGKASILDVSKLHIYDCEGNVSDGALGNHCGVKKAILKNKNQNPSGYHRCWASVNHKDDELWKISKALFDDTDAVMFFGSVRWGQANGVYQRLIERLTWLENRHTTLGERNILKDIDAGVVFVGQNWNGKDVLKTQKSVLQFFGFNVPDIMSWNWQYTDNAKDETEASYKKGIEAFNKQFKPNN
jgi:multimeric flavodoxin WrbA